jgi:hypothetical protein
VIDVDPVCGRAWDVGVPRDGRGDCPRRSLAILMTLGWIVGRCDERVVTEGLRGSRPQSETKLLGSDSKNSIGAHH